jgi:O-antigen ligase
MNSRSSRLLNGFRESLAGEGGARADPGDILVVLGSVVFAAGVSWSHVSGYIGMALVVAGRLFCPAPYSLNSNIRKFLVPMVLLFLWGMGLSIFAAIRPVEGFFAVFAYFAHWMVPFMAGLWAVWRLGPRIAYIWLGSLFILGFISLLAFLGLFHAPAFSKEGMVVGLHNHIQFAALLFLGLNLVYALFLTPGISRNRSALLAAVGIFLLLFFLLSGSRGWWAAAGISLTGITIHHIIKNRARKTALKLAIAGILIIFISIAAFPQIRARISMTSLSDPNLVYRNNMAVMALEIIKDNPVFGIGPGQTPYAKEYYDRMKKANLPQETGYLQKKHFHNIYLQMAAEFGLPGLILFLMILLGAFRLLLRAARGERKGYETAIIYGAFWSWIAFAVAEIFDCLLRGPAAAMEYFWILGVCAGMGKKLMTPLSGMKAIYIKG